MLGLDVVRIFRESGPRRYGESVTQLAHALQSAEHARRDGAGDDLVLAALLHDIGHLTGPRGAESPAQHHGEGGAAIVRPFVPEHVAWVIEHHVAAKRYLCAVDRGYADRLSPASTRSLAAQGGALPEPERGRLEAHAWFADAVRVRRWDDLAKVQSAVTVPLDAYRALLERYFGPQSNP
jgi:gamma-butyrobetaine dioxygenase